MRKKPKSMFEPYKNLIEEMLSSGMSNKEMSVVLEQKLGFEFHPSGLNIFMRKEGITSNRERFGREKAIRCSECNMLKEIQKWDGSPGFICSNVEPNRIVGATCLTSPMWCPKREDKEIV